MNTRDNSEIRELKGDELDKVTGGGGGGGSPYGDSDLHQLD